MRVRIYSTTKELITMKKSISLLFFFVSLFSVNEAFAQCPIKVYLHNSVKERMTIELLNENQEVICQISDAQKVIQLTHVDNSKCQSTTKYSFRVKPCINCCAFPCYYAGGDYNACVADCEKQTKGQTPVILPLLGSKSEFDANPGANGYVVFE